MSITIFRKEQLETIYDYPSCGRLTLESGVANSVVDQTAKTSLYWTPYNGNEIALYNGTRWKTISSPEVELSLSGLGRSQAYTNDPASGSNISLSMTDTSGFQVNDIVKISSSAGSECAIVTTVNANTSIVVNILALNHTTTSPLVTALRPYDIYGYLSGSSMILESSAWTNTTTRATDITLQNGIRVKNGDATRKYLGTISTSFTVGQCEDSFTKRFVWNNYNRLLRPIKKYIEGRTIASTSDIFILWNSGSSNAGLDSLLMMVSGSILYNYTSFNLLMSAVDAGVWTGAKLYLNNASISSTAWNLNANYETVSVGQPILYSSGINHILATWRAGSSGGKFYDLNTYIDIQC